MLSSRPLRKATGFGFALGMAVGLVLAALAMPLIAPRAAVAQIPDSGRQRDLLIKEQQITNERLGEVVGLLREIRDLQPGAPIKKAKGDGR